MPKKTTKREKIIRALTVNPDFPVEEMAEEIGCTPAHVYTVRKELVGPKTRKRSRVTKREKIIAAFESDPYASPAAVAKIAKCSASYARTVRNQHRDFLDQHIPADEFVTHLTQGEPWLDGLEPAGNAVSALRYAAPLAVFLWVATLVVGAGVYFL